LVYSIQKKKRNDASYTKLQRSYTKGGGECSGDPQTKQKNGHGGGEKTLLLSKGSREGKNCQSTRSATFFLVRKAKGLQQDKKIACTKPWLLTRIKKKKKNSEHPEGEGVWRRARKYLEESEKRKRTKTSALRSTEKRDERQKGGGGLRGGVAREEN